MIVTTVLVSCKKDRPAPEPEPKPSTDPKTAVLAAKAWTPVSATQLSGSTRVNYPLTADELKDKYTFKADGSFTMVAYNSPGSSFSGTWVWKDTAKTIVTLTLTTKEVVDVVVITSSSATLVLEWPNKRQITYN